MKKFKNIDEQVKHLVENKNIKTDEKIKKVLKERTYASIINAYKIIFTTNVYDRVHEYSNQVSIDDYIRMAELDDNLSNRLHYMIGIFEKKLKNAVSYEYSKYLNSQGDDTCTSYISNFKQFINEPFNKEMQNILGLKEITYIYTNKSSLKQATISNFNYNISILSKIVNTHKNPKTNIVKHYSNDGNIPFWLIPHELTLGELSGFIGLLNHELRRNIYKNFLNIEEIEKVFSVNKFFNNITHLKDLRNVINHYEPIIPFIKDKKVEVIKNISEMLKNVVENSSFNIGEKEYLNSVQTSEFSEELINKTNILLEII